MIVIFLWRVFGESGGEIVLGVRYFRLGVIKCLRSITLRLMDPVELDEGLWLLLDVQCL